MNTEHPTELNTNTRLALLRDACHNRDAERVAPLLVDAPDLCWDYAFKHGMAPVDWAEVDRKVYSYIPATHHTVTCATCQGQGARIDPAGIPSVHQDACPDCFDGLRRAPTPPLWVQRSCVSRADWIAHVGSFPEVYLLWSTLHRPAGASTTTATVLDPDGFPVTLADPEALYPPAEVEPFTYCNAVSRSARWPREVWCYEVEPGLVVPDSWAFMVWGLQGPVSVVWRADGLGFRLPTHHETACTVRAAAPISLRRAQLRTDAPFVVGR
ncbi:MAG: hypothetical protein AAFX99_28360, partial [Myxococcota bacterium]